MKRYFPIPRRAGRHLAFLGFVLGCLSRADAANPAWWSAPATTIFNGAPADHWTVANVGQLKHVATQAKAYLDDQLGLTATDWNQAYGSAAANPFPFAEGSHPENSAPVNIGQLKAVAVGFYRILGEAGYPVRKSLIYQGVDSGEISYHNGSWVPWNAFPLHQENYAPVNIGQLKLVFGFSVNSDGSSAFNLSSVEDTFAVGADDNDGDLVALSIEGTVGLSETQYDTASSVAAVGENPNVDAAVQDDGGTGPLIVLPDRGFYNVHQPELTLQKL